MIRKSSLQAPRSGGIFVGVALAIAGCSDGPPRIIHPRDFLSSPTDFAQPVDFSAAPGDDASVAADDSAAPPPDDLSRVTVADAPPAPGGDGGMVSCINIATWPGLKPLGGFDSQNVVTYAASIDQTMAPFNALGIEDFHAMGANYPKKVTYTSSDNYNTCDVCTVIQVCTAQSCNNRYFAQAGSVTVTRADQSAVKGRMTATATNLKLVEWNFMGDKPIFKGKCYLIGSASFDVAWDKGGDGGVSGGDSGMTGTDSGMIGADSGMIGADSGMIRADSGMTGDAPAPADLKGSTKDGGAGDLAATPGCVPLVNEVMSTGTKKASEEFVEIYNPCPTAIDITGWTLDYRSQGNNAGNADSLLFTFASPMAAGDYRVIGGTAWTGPSDGTFSGGGLAEAGGAVGLRDAGGQLVDSMSYSVLMGPNDFTQTAPAPNPPKGNSVSRIPNGVSTGDNSKDFKVSKMLTPKAANQ